MITLSYSTIKDLYQTPHTWINKQMGLKTEEKPWFKPAKDLHRVVQNHVAGIKKDPRLEKELRAYLFPVVERKDFDTRTKFLFQISKDYYVHGYADGLNPITKRILEIKTGTIWSLPKFQDSMQRKIYAHGFPEYGESVLITVSSDLKKIKKYVVDNTFEDTEEAKSWIKGGVAIIENIKNLVPPGTKCDGCSYGPNCYFI